MLSKIEISFDRNELVVESLPAYPTYTATQMPYYGSYWLSPYSADLLFGIFFLLIFLMIPLVFMIMFIKMIGGVFTSE